MKQVAKSKESHAGTGFGRFAAAASQWMGSAGAFALAGAVIAVWA